MCSAAICAKHVRNANSTRSANDRRLSWLSSISLRFRGRPVYLRPLSLPCFRSGVLMKEFLILRLRNAAIACDQCKDHALAELLTEAINELENLAADVREYELNGDLP